MHKFLDTAKAALQDLHSPSAHPPPPSPPAPPTSSQAPTALDVLRYRYHHGVNLGSVFVLERWLHGSMFNGADGASELEAVTHSVRTCGLAATRQRWEAHWRGAVSDAEMGFVARGARCSSVRLPVGYFTLGAEFAAGTAFEEVREVYSGAWAVVREVVARARRVGVGVLLDLHAVPGGANGEGHSGTGSGRAGLWGSARDDRLAVRCLAFMAREVRDGLDGVVGIQLCNEAVWGAEGMYGWYEKVVQELGRIDSSIPLYVSDAWDLERALAWTTSTGKHAGGRNPIVVDTHKYYTFSDADRSQTPAQLVAKVPGELSELDGKEGWLCGRGEAQVIVGEYSCVLDGQTWARVQPEEKDGYVKQFGLAQSSKWQQRAGGSYFWTWKMEWMDGGEWGFIEQVKKGNIAAPAWSLLSDAEIKQRAQIARDRRVPLGQEARSSHENYWNVTTPGGYFEHDRYSTGWHLGYTDALAFFSMHADGALGDDAVDSGADKIGCLDIWVKKRLWEAGPQGQFVWEWEQGFRAGVGAFDQVVGI